MAEAQSGRPAAQHDDDARFRELKRLIETAERRALRHADATRLALLYRGLASALLQGRRAGRQQAQREQTMLRAYHLVHAPEPVRRARLLGAFLGSGFPRLVRRELRAIGLAALVLLLGALCGGAVVHWDQAAMAVVVPDMHQAQTPTERVRGEAAQLPFDPGSSAVFSSFLFTHNIQVTFLVFALGLTAGIGTAALLFWNGIPLGALAAQYVASGEGLFFAAWILPHGVLELSVVAIAGGAGFVLARALWRPGPMRRREALHREASSALRLVLGGMPLLVVAGLVEGSLSQLHPPHVPIWGKLLVAALLALALLAYLGGAGRARLSGSRAGDVDG